MITHYHAIRSQTDFFEQIDLLSNNTSTSIFSCCVWDEYLKIAVGEAIYLFDLSTIPDNEVIDYIEKAVNLLRKNKLNQQLVLYLE